jgi:hypothetical protein
LGHQAGHAHDQANAALGRVKLLEKEREDEEQANDHEQKMIAQQVQQKIPIPEGFFRVFDRLVYPKDYRGEREDGEKKFAAKVGERVNSRHLGQNSENAGG